MGSPMPGHCAGDGLEGGGRRGAWLAAHWRTWPNTTCLPSSQGVSTVQMKNLGDAPGGAASGRRVATVGVVCMVMLTRSVNETWKRQGGPLRMEMCVCVSVCDAERQWPPAVDEIMNDWRGYSGRWYWENARGEGNGSPGRRTGCRWCWALRWPCSGCRDRCAPLHT